MRSSWEHLYTIVCRGIDPRFCDLYHRIDAIYNIAFSPRDSVDRRGGKATVDRIASQGAGGWMTARGPYSKRRSSARF